MNNTKLRIIADKDIFESDEFITGKLSLKSRIPLPVKKIKLNFTKSRVMEVCKIETSGKKGIKYSNNKKEYSYDFDIYTSRNEFDNLSSGAHLFPFKFFLKSTDSSTTDIKGIYFDYLVNINNSYTLTASLYLNGASEAIYETTKDVQVVEVFDRTEHFQTKLEVSTMLCLLYKTYTLKFFLNKPLYYSGDRLKLDVQMNRSLLKLIDNIECNLYEVINVHSPEIDIIRTRYVVGGNAILEKKRYALSLNIPSTTPTCVNEDMFGLKILMFINITFKKSGPIRIRKYLQVVKRKNELPDIENLDVLDGEVFNEKIFLLT